MRKSLIGDFTLLFVTLCWGITFPLIENAVKEVDPAVFMAIRFLLAALILLPFFLRKLGLMSIKSVLKAGVLLAVLNTFLYLSQAIGMQTVSAAQGAFLTGTTVVIVPFLQPFFKLGSIKRDDIMYAWVCLIGLFLLTGASFLNFNSGMLWILLCAFFNAMSIVYLQKVTLYHKNLGLLAFMQIVLTGIFLSMFTPGKSFLSLSSTNVMIGILFCSVFATAIALFLQTKYQHYTTVNRAAMIFCLEPVFGAAFGYLLNGEAIGVTSMIGMILILVSILRIDFIDFTIRIRRRYKLVKG